MPYKLPGPAFLGRGAFCVIQAGVSLPFFCDES